MADAVAVVVVDAVFVAVIVIAMINTRQAGAMRRRATFTVAFS